MALDSLLSCRSYISIFLIIMTKNQTLEMKGVAILFMLFWHLMKDPISAYIGRCMNPVAFFLLLSGYGLYIVNQREDNHKYKRIIRLYINYWVVLLLFIVVGHWTNPGYYFISPLSLLGNFIGLNPTFIPEVWFLLPYIFLALLSKPLKNILDKCNGWIAFGGLFFFSVGTSYCLSRFGVTYLYPHRCLYVIFCFFHLLFPFALGMLSARYELFHLIGQRVRRNEAIPTLFWSICLLSLMWIRCLINISVFHPLYVFLFINIFIQIPKYHFIEYALQRLGKCSMNMWFIHTSLFIYLFPQRPLVGISPVLYFIIVTITCWLVAEALNILVRPIINKINI